jgi:hypothetical protein
MVAMVIMMLQFMRRDIAGAVSPSLEVSEQADAARLNIAIASIMMVLVIPYVF